MKMNAHQGHIVLRNQYGYSLKTPPRPHLPLRRESCEFIQLHCYAISSYCMDCSFLMKHADRTWMFFEASRVWYDILSRFSMVIWHVPAKCDWFPFVTKGICVEWESPFPQFQINCSQLASPKFESGPSILEAWTTTGKKTLLLVSQELQVTLTVCDNQYLTSCYVLQSAVSVVCIYVTVHECWWSVILQLYRASYLYVSFK